MTRGERIGAARKRVEISRSELGQRCGAAERNVYRWEIENIEPRAEVLLRLADALGVSVRWLLTGDDPPEWFADDLVPTGTEG
jgi:transcriptional regulator with XRE-family HTH domain